MTDVVKNIVLVIGDTWDEIDNFIDSVSGYGWDGEWAQVLTFHSILPVPSNSTWFETWGTSWDAMFSDGARGGYTRFTPGELIEGSHCVQYEFDTAHSPPWKTFEVLRERFPELLIVWNCKGEFIDATWSSETNSVFMVPTISNWADIFSLFSSPEEHIAGAQQESVLPWGEPWNEPEPTHLHGSRQHADAGGTIEGSEPVYIGGRVRTPTGT